MSRHRFSELLTFARFCVVGGFGFIVDATVLVALTALAGLDPIVARLISVAIAVTATWAIHRGFTFRSTDPGRLGEWSRFATVNVAGSAINFAVYWAVLLAAPATWPIVALAVGSAVALIANYAGSRVFAFRQMPGRG